MSQLPYFLLLLFSVLSSFPMKSDGQGTNSFEKACPSHDCYGVSIRYPFWLLDSTTWQEFCGYPGFGITCSSDTDFPIIKLSNGEYYVKNIDYVNYTLTLVDIDVVGQKCPRVTHSLGLEPLPLFTSDLDLNLIFYFNCTSDFRPPGVQIDCLASGSNISYVCEPERFDDTNWQEYCEDKVEAAVMEPRNGIDGFGNESSSAFNEGFLLDWRSLKYCGECEASGGRCGFNNVTKVFLCFCSDGTIKNNKQYCPAGGKLNLGLKIGIGLGAAAITVILLVCLCCLRKFLLNTSVLSWKTMDKDVEAFIRQYEALTPKRYTYSQIKNITNSFKDELGKGGYGNVFKGKLLDGRVVAVKVMKVSRGNAEEFMNEVSSIGRTSHVNVVTLLGFCYEGKKRALLYEFMPNGSLEKFIYGKNPSFARQHLGWETLYNIALGIARGLEYLHRGCNTRILHFDIKPHNILLDEDFCPKISDFGFAKLSTRKDSKISMMEARGTIGYIAPEVFSRNFGGVSHKSDVYSYGMMVLEMTGGRKNVDAGAGHTSDIYFPRWIYKHIELNEELNLPSAMTVEEKEIAKKMIVVGLWCIQMDPSQRPSISKVMEMLEGSIMALEIPPPPYLCSSSRSTSNSLPKPSLSFSSSLASNSSLNLVSFSDPASESNSLATLA